jgi:hypothetical protein
MTEKFLHLSMGLAMQRWYKVLCTTIGLIAMAAPSMAADPNAAMVYARGTAWVNGAAIPKSSAIFPGDLVQTKPDSIANINAQGTSVVVQADSLVKLQANALELEHGAINVATSKSMAAHIGDLTIAPASGNWTEFQVADLDGTVKIIARKGDLSLQDDQGSTTLPAGQETTREETHHKKHKRTGGGAVTAAQGSLLDSPAVIYGGTAVIGGVTAWVLLQGDDPASPDKP